MIPREVIEQVQNTAKIEEVVGEYMSLKRRGANLWGLCPFHNEKTPSFSVSPSKGIYKCFGCGKAGNAISFVMEMDQCSYVDAIKKVAKRYHIEVPDKALTPEEQQIQDDRESMFVVNDYANQWFQDQLFNTDDGQHIGLAYFRERGLREDTIRHFQLGFSPEKGNQLAKALKKQGFVEKYIINDPDNGIGTGICGKSEDGRIYDRFRDRVIFPIHSVSGKIVGFAGRLLKKKENVGKYINSPDSLIYSKTNELYGFYLAKKAIVEKQLCYLVEGQMDVISMYQAGIKNVVAGGGTALTKQQIRLIHRFTSNITVLYDSDSAGAHAALRSIDMLLEEGFNIKMLRLPKGEDPDSFCRTHNASDFIEYIEQHQTDFMLFKIQLLSEQFGNDVQAQSQIIHEVVNSIAQIHDSITRQMYLKDCAERMGINEQILVREAAHIRQQKREEMLKEQNLLNASDKPQPAESKESKLEQNYRNLLRLIIRYGEMDLYADENGNTCSVGDYIISQFQEDELTPPNELYERIIDEYIAHRSDEGFVAESFFKNHVDPEISAFAISQIADRYQLSRIYNDPDPKQNGQAAQKAKLQQRLPGMVRQLLIELKYTLINMRMQDVEALVKQAQTAGDWQTTQHYLAQLKALIDARRQIGKLIGR